MHNPTQFLSEGQINDILESMENPRDKVLFTFLAYTGRRISEVVRCLKPRDIYSEEKMINTTFLKKRKPFKDLLPINEKAFDMLLSWINNQGIGRDDYIFPISRQQVDRIFKRYCYKLDIMTIGDGERNMPHVHLLRHSFAIMIAKRCRTLEDIYSLQRLMGHSKLEQTMWYINHFNPTAQRELLKRM